MTSVNPQCSVLVFTSPQTITDKFPHFVASVADHVSFVVVDELHMFNAFGRSFRKEFQALKHHLFLVVKTSVPILFLTASCNKQIHASFERMIGVKITHLDWPDAVAIQNRRVSLFSHYFINCEMPTFESIPICI